MTSAIRHRLEKERDRVFGALEDAARTLGKRDAYLLEHDVREEALYHRLAYYLEENLLNDPVLDLEDFSVDCEYNFGNAYLREALHVLWPKAGEMQLRDRDNEVRPDIIVHQRGSDNERVNLLMVEVKKSTLISQAAEKFALLKCETYRKSTLNYLFSGYICFITGEPLQPGHDPWRAFKKFPKKAV